MFWICFSLVDFILMLRQRSSQITNFTRSSGSTGPPGCHHGWHHRQAKHHSTQEKCEVFPGRSWLCSSEISWNFTMQSSSAVVVLLFQEFIPESSTGGSQHFGDSLGRAESERNHPLGCGDVSQSLKLTWHSRNPTMRNWAFSYSCGIILTTLQEYAGHSQKKHKKICRWASDQNKFQNNPVIRHQNHHPIGVWLAITLLGMIYSSPLAG